jgi:hypothetical protein
VARDTIVEGLAVRTRDSFQFRLSVPLVDFVWCQIVDTTR